MKLSNGHRSKRRLILRIDLPALLAFAFFAGLIFLYLIPGFKTVMMERKRELIHEMTASAYSLLVYYHSLESEGQMEPELARQQALEAISRIRYGNELKDYFWITDMEPVMLMHPYRPDLIGQNLSLYHDSRGKAVFVDFVNEASASGESYVDYMWQWNDDSTRIVPKLSYVRLFKPWSWVIGTGIYVEDVRSEIRGIIIRALIISGIIGVLIIVLLINISRQGHKLEEKRKAAEDELLKSRELYRTLAEAATEGVMIWSEQGLQVNKTMLSWLGYSDQEAQGLGLPDIFKSDDGSTYTDPSALYAELASRIHVKGVIQTREGHSLPAHADLSRIDLNGTQAVLAVVRPASGLQTLPQFVPQNEMLGGISVGFFRISYGKRNRFLMATSPTVELLGFPGMQELLSSSLDVLFEDPLQLKTFRSVLAAGNDFVNQEVLLKQKNGSVFWALINVMLVKSANETWCEGTIERLSIASFTPSSLSHNLLEYAASYLMNAPVSVIMRPPVFCLESASIQDVMSILNEEGSSSAIVVDKTGQTFGTLDIKDIAVHLAADEPLHTPAFRWMKAPPVYLRPQATIGQAIKWMQQGNHACILVSESEATPTGMITIECLNHAFSLSPGILLQQIQDAKTLTTLKKCFADSQSIAAYMVSAGAEPNAVFIFISVMADAILNRVVALSESEMGSPPCRYAFIQTGSAGRREQSFSTDQDNGIVFENLSAEKIEAARQYFLILGKKVNDMLAAIGFRYCKGGNMAGNIQWCQPLSQWKKYFKQWIEAPGPEELLDVSIFFDFRFAYGDEKLVADLDEYIRTGLHTSDIFFYHMAKGWKAFSPSASILEDGKTDVKRLLLPLTGIIRMYALKYGIKAESTVDRILGLYAIKQMDHVLMRNCLSSWKNLSTLRLTHQVDAVMKGTEPGNIITYTMDEAKTIYSLRQSLDTIQQLLTKSGTDFHTGMM